MFTLTLQKKYVEITKVILTPVPSTAVCGGSLFYSEGLKAFFGPTCTFAAFALGTVVLKTGDCSQEPVGGTPAPSDFPSSNVAGYTPVYACVDGNLVVNNVLVPTANITFNVTGPGSFNMLNTLGALCAGTPGATSSTAAVATSVTFCATGPGAGTVSACLAQPLPNEQPEVCSTAIQFTFTQTAARVVPYVRWAGEKVALTKCFGPGLAGAPVEFVLKGDNPGLDAALIPTDLTTTIGLTGGTTPVADTVWTVTDGNGCASVIGYADGEGVMYVDAAIFSTTGAGIEAGQPLVNEHAFEVFFLKFDHVDIENINPAQSYNVSATLSTFLGLVAGTPAVLGATTFPSGSATFTLPSPPGTNTTDLVGPNTYAVPLCATQFIRAMVHGYFEIPGDPSGRPATSVAIPGAPAASGGTASAGSYVLPAGRWVLPEDWPVLATFAGFGLSGQPADFTPSSVLAWDLNSGWVFNPGGENPDVCIGPYAFAPDVLANGTGEGVSYSSNNGGYGTINLTENASASQFQDEDLGPCFGIDGAGTAYETAGNSTFSDGTVATAPDCAGGLTVGIGPYDATQECTTPLQLTYKPAGGNIVGGIGPGTPGCPSGVPAPCLAPAGLNSTYLPNGTLNEWDAPMPPAMVSFGIQPGSPGFLDEVNKTGLYALTFDIGAQFTCPSNTSYSSASLACVNPYTTVAPTCNATGYTYDPVTGTCRLNLDPDPFYAEAIPASPFIPPVANDAGYLWNSWNFQAGTVTAVRSAPTCFSNAPAGGCVPGQSTTVTIAATTAFAATPAGITCLGPTTPYFHTNNSGASCTEPGGLAVTDCATTGAGGSDSIIVADGSGFLPGMSVEIYSATDGTTLVGGDGTGPVIQAVIPAPQTGFPNAVELVFEPGALTGFNGVCGGGPFSVVVIGEEFGLPVPSVAAFQGQDSITIGSGGTTNLTVPISTSGLDGSQLIDTTNNIVYVDFTASIADLFGPCSGSGSGISRLGGPATNPFCEPNYLIPPGTLLETGPVAAGGAIAAHGPPANPYPFWQFVAAPPAQNQFPTSGTVYSDNHGEAVVAYQTGIATQLAPVNGACPTPYSALAINGTVVTCQLPFGTLGSLGFSNVSTATTGFSASNPGCIQTFPSGTQGAAPGATIGATGPANGQICVNNLGGIEFGTGATLGSATITAVADYPYTRGEHPPVASPPLTKVFRSGFAKTVTVSPLPGGVPGPAGTTSYTVTVTATDVCGNPLFGEPVQVYALGNAGATVLAPVSAGVVLSANTTSAVVTVDPVTGQAVLSLEILNTAIGTQGLVIKAVFPFEKIERFVTVIPGSTPGATVNVPYPPGWNQIGGPPNSNFSVAEAVFSYDPIAGTYTNATASAGSLSSAAPTCTGYWAYFAAAMVVSLPASNQTGTSVSCTLQAGWNLVGNPFSTPAMIQSGVTAYHWNGTSYDTVGTIPVGGSVWVYNDGTLGTLSLTAT
jgi:hypothetical protein